MIRYQAENSALAGVVGVVLLEEVRAGIEDKEPVSARHGVLVESLCKIEAVLVLNGRETDAEKSWAAFQKFSPAFVFG